MSLIYGFGTLITYFFSAHLIRKVDEKSIIRNQCHRFPHPAQDTKWKRKTNTKDDIYYKTAQLESQEDRYFPPRRYLQAIQIQAKKVEDKEKADEQ